MGNPLAECLHFTGILSQNRTDTYEQDRINEETII